jgi:hypothetical protein
MLRERFFDGGMDRQESGQPGNLDYGGSLLRQAGQSKAFARVSAVHKELHQRADSGGVQKGHATHIENEMRRSFRTQRLDEIVDGFETQLATEPSDEAVRVRSRQSLQIKLYRLHKL